MTKSIKNYEYIDCFDSVQKLYELLRTKQYDMAVKQIAELKKEISGFKFPLDSSTYSRHILCKKDGYWLLLIHWDENVSTYIHGHPERSFVYVIDGLLEIENFKTNPLSAIGRNNIHPDQYLYTDGKTNRFDNDVHQIHTKQKTMSLHFYSDDPSKGDVYVDEE